MWASADAEGAQSTGPIHRSSSFGRMQQPHGAHNAGGPFGQDGFYAASSGIGSPMGTMQPHGSSSMSAMSSMSSSSHGHHSSGPYRRDRPYQPVADYSEDYLNDGPLLQELGVDFSHIYLKVQSVLHPLAATSTPSQEIMQDSDMAGPIVFCVVLGFLLLLAGKVHFGYIYGFGLFGVLAMWTILNLMAEPSSGINNDGQGIDFSRTFSILGYALLPVVGLAGIAVLFDMKGLLGEWCLLCRLLPRLASPRFAWHFSAFPCSRHFPIPLRHLPVSISCRRFLGSDFHHLERLVVDALLRGRAVDAGAAMARRIPGLPSLLVFCSHHHFLRQRRKYR